MPVGRQGHAAVVLDGDLELRDRQGDLGHDAVAGEDLAVVAAACARLGVATDALGAAETAGLVALEPGRVRFTHPLARSGVYAVAAPDRRRALHAAVADVLKR